MGDERKADEEPVPYELTAEAYDAGLLDENGLSRLWEVAPPVHARTTGPPS